MIPRRRFTGDQTSIASEVLERLLEDPSRIVQVNALEGIARLAEQHAQFADLADAAISRAARSPHASVRARARRLTR